MVDLERNTEHKEPEAKAGFECVGSAQVSGTYIWKFGETVGWPENKALMKRSMFCSRDTRS